MLRLLAVVSCCRGVSEAWFGQQTNAVVVRLTLRLLLVLNYFVLSIYLFVAGYLSGGFGGDWVRVRLRINGGGG